MLDNELMDKIIARCQEDPEFKKVFEQLMSWSQKASQVKMEVNEMASICMMGYAIGQDPELQDMIQNMLKISNLGLDIVDE
jgi:hypothetical protein|tara:strand:+ start:2194 stop:2436 length:243 start_codon:yes stop_codon:yes gene_type:complete